MNQLKTLPIFFLLLLILSVQDTFAAPIALEYRFKTGQNDRYNAAITSEQSSTDSATPPAAKETVNVLLSQIVKNATVTHDAQIELYIKGINKDSRRITPTMHKFSINKYGELAEAAAQSPVTGTLINLPKTGVNPGDSWAGRVRLPSDMGSIESKCTYDGTVAGPGGRRVYRVVQKYIARVDNPASIAKYAESIPGSTAKTQIEGTETYLLDRVDCRVMAMNSTVTLTVTVEQPKAGSAESSRVQYKTTMKTVLTKTQ